MILSKTERKKPWNREIIIPYSRQNSDEEQENNSEAKRNTMLSDQHFAIFILSTFPHFLTLQTHTLYRLQQNREDKWGGEPSEVRAPTKRPFIDSFVNVTKILNNAFSRNAVNYCREGVSFFLFTLVKLGWILKTKTNHLTCHDSSVDIGHDTIKSKFDLNQLNLDR